MRKSAQLTRFIRTVRHQESEPCRNCDTSFIGKFCPECGQEADTGAPTAVGFIYEFLTRNVLEKGKFPRTVWHLLRYPGGLTVDFLEGRRARYIRPVRIYLIFSILYFLLLSFQANSLVKNLSVSADAAAQAQKASQEVRSQLKSAQTATDAELKKIMDSNETDKSAKQIVKELAKSMKGIDKATEQADAQADAKQHPKVVLTIDDKKKSEADLKKLVEMIHIGNPAHEKTIRQELLKRIEHFNALTQEQQINEVLHGAINQAPKAMFFLLPVFALILKMLFVFRSIPYGAHLLFSVHYHALVFLCLLFLLMPVPSPVMAAVILYIFAYLPVAMRTTYLCSWVGALARCFLLSILYFIAVWLAMAGTLILALLG